MTPTLLILAASAYQLPFIHAARDAGCRLITVDNRPDNPGHRFAHVSIDCDTTAGSSIVEIARRHHINGVLAAATDVALVSASQVCEELGLPGPSRHCVELLTQKRRFRKLQNALGLPAPRLIGASTAGAELYPLIIKPNRSSGSKGIRVASHATEVPRALAEAKAMSIDGDALIESYVEGIQGTLEGRMQDGRAIQLVVTDRMTAPLPFVATRGHRTPSSLSPHVLASLLQQVETVFREVGYSDGPFDCDFLYSDGEIHIIEMTPRVGGNSLVNLVRISSGFDLPRYAVDFALGRAQAEHQLTSVPAAVRILSSPHSGQLFYDPGKLDEARALPGIHHLQIDVPPGNEVARFTDGRRRFGEALATGTSPEDAELAIDAALEQIGLRIEKA